MIDPKLQLAFALVSAVPSVLAVRANWHTSLLHTSCWVLAASFTWCLAPLLQADVVSTASPWSWIVFAATAAPIVSLLGARKPTVLAWNFVVVGFLATLLFPVLSNQIIGSDMATPFQYFFLGTTLAVGVINYLPTRLMPAAIVFAIGCAGLLLHDVARPFTLRPDFHAGCVLLSPLLAWARLARRASDDPFDDYWLRYRNRFGWLWAQRAREQFNHAAQNAGWPIQLGWRGLVGGQTATNEQRDEWFRTLRAVLKRFMDERS